MGGSSENSRTQTQQIQNTNQNTAYNNRQQTSPFGPAEGVITGILGTIPGINALPTGIENNAFARLLGSANAGNPFAGSITGVANTLLGGGGPDRTGIVNDAYQQYLKALAPTASGAGLDLTNNPLASTIATDVTDSLKGLYAGAGRDPAGAGNFGQNLARGIGQGLAPIYQSERANQLAAINNMFGAGGTTAGLLSNLDQTRLQNLLSGIGATAPAIEAQSYGPMLALQVEAQRRGIPIQTLAQEMGITLPAAQAFGTTTGSGTANTIGTNIGNSTTTQETPLWQQIAGGVIGGLGTAARFLPFGR